jgi:hypothetical protein
MHDKDRRPRNSILRRWLVPRLQAKNFDEPDETRALQKAAARVVYLDEVAVGLAILRGR